MEECHAMFIEFLVESILPPPQEFPQRLPEHIIDLTLGNGQSTVSHTVVFGKTKLVHFRRRRPK